MPECGVPCDGIIAKQFGSADGLTTLTGYQTEIQGAPCLYERFIEPFRRFHGGLEQGHRPGHRSLTICNDPEMIVGGVDERFRSRCLPMLTTTQKPSLSQFIVASVFVQSTLSLINI